MKRYDIVVNGIETTFLLSDEDAKARGLKPADEAKAETKQKTPQNKQAEPANKKV